MCHVQYGQGEPLAFRQQRDLIVESTLTPYCDGDINPQNFVITLFIEDDEDGLGMAVFKVTFCPSVTYFMIVVLSKYLHMGS